MPPTDQVGRVIGAEEVARRRALPPDPNAPGALLVEAVDHGAEV